MLLNLHIKNYALIEELGLEFADGLVIFTGETGAGKSIIIEAVGLLLGDRASAMAVRTGAERCSLTGEFDVARLPDLARYLAEASLADDGGSLIVRREIDREGRSRAFVNDRPVSIGTLQAIGEYLVDVHGQHDHQSLLKSAAQRELVDRYGETGELLTRVGAGFETLRALVAQRDSRQISEHERQRLVDLYGFQVQEIDAAKLLPGEEEEIAAALPTLKNAEKLKELGEEAYLILYGADGSVLERLGKVRRLLETVRSLAGALPETAETLDNACSGLEEVARDIDAFRDSLSADPEKLNDLLSRQDLIQKLKKKYGPSIPEILACREKTGRELNALMNTEQDRRELDGKIERAEQELASACEKLSAARRKAGEKLARGVEKELQDLGMKKARFQVSLEREERSASHGWDRLEFLFSANAGESPKPLKSIASGGEMSRVMLALKTVLAKADRVPVLIFDEIDAGIGGPMGQTVGKKLRELARHHQVLCITHLPQIAAFGSLHLSVAKEDVRGRTRTAVRPLTGAGRVDEIARMLSGESITPLARKHAQELMGLSS